MLKRDELPAKLITADVWAMSVTSWKRNSSHFNILIYSLLYAIVTSDEFFLIRVKSYRS